MFYVYILKSTITDKFYIGSTSDLEKRLKAHNSGSNRSTKNSRPWVRLYEETYNNKPDAIKRELQIKRYKGGVAFKKLIGLV